MDVMISLIKLDKMKPMRLYLRQVIDLNPIDKENTHRVNIFCNNELDDNIKILSSKIFLPISSRNYCSSSIFKLKLKTRSVIQRNLNIDLYKAIKKTTSIKKTNNKLSTFKGANVFLDISKFLKMLFVGSTKYKFTQKFPFILDRFIDHTNSMIGNSEYNDKVLIFYIKEPAYTTNGIEKRLKNECNDLLTYLLAIKRYVKDDKLTSYNLDSYKILFLNPDTRISFLCSFSDLEKNKYSKLFRFFKKLTSGISPEDPEYNEIDNENVEKDVTSEDEVEVKSNIKSTIEEDIKSSEEEKNKLKDELEKVTKPVENKKVLVFSNKVEKEKPSEVIPVVSKKTTKIELEPRENEEKTSPNNIRKSEGKPTESAKEVEVSNKSNYNFLDLGFIKANTHHFTGALNSDEIEEELSSPKEEKSSDNFTNDVLEAIPNANPNLEELQQADEDLQKFDELIHEEKVKEDKESQIKKLQRQKRETQLREEAKKVIFDEKNKLTLEEVMNIEDPKEYEDPKIFNKITTTNPSNYNAKTSYMDKYYVDELMEKDQALIFNSLSDPDRTIPVFVKKITRENTSDAFNKKETITVNFTDGNHVSHTFKIDVPILIDDRFMFLNNSKKVINRQLVCLPIVKIKEGEVALTSNYNKVVLARFGRKISGKIERFFKFIDSVSFRAADRINLELGNNTVNNANFVNNLEVEEISHRLNKIKLPNKIFLFDRKELDRILKDKFPNYKPTKDENPIGISDSGPILISFETGKMLGIPGEENTHFLDYIIKELSKVRPDLEKKYKDIKITSKFFYTRAKILNRQISLFLLLASKLGLTKLLEYAKIKYGFSEKRPKFDDPDEYTVIRFANGYFYFQSYPISNGLLLNGINELPTTELNFEIMDDTSIYIDFFDQLFNSRAIAKGYDNFLEQFLDPITKNICKDLGLPTNIYEFFLEGNRRLESNVRPRDNDLHNFRIRGPEIINTYLNKILNNAYSKYKNSFNNNHPDKIAVERNALIKAVQADPLVENYSTLNPVTETMSLTAVKFRGTEGFNIDEGYSAGKRGFDPTFQGILSIATPYSASVGDTRHLSVDPKIINPRGYLEPGNPDDPNYTPENVMTHSEILNTFTVGHDDSPRVAMASSQTSALVAPLKNDIQLITYGTDRALPYLLTSDFVNKAKGKGKVIEKTDGYLYIQYDNGEKEVVDLNHEIIYNGGSGFYTGNEKTCNLKVGDRVNKNDIIAYNKNFFADRGFGIQYLQGTLAKVAILSGYYNYEDAVLASESLSERMSTYVTMVQDRILDPKTTVSQIAKVGDHINAGDTLLKFEPAYSDKDFNAFLANLGEEMKQDIENMSRNLLLSKYTGVIKDIRIYYTCDIETMSPSLRKVVEDYIKRVNTTHDKINKFFGGETPNIILPPTEKYKSENGKLMGKDVGEVVMIEFYIEHKDYMGIGNKLTFATALKGVISEVIPSGLEPYTENKPDEKIESFLSPISINNRMTASIWLQLYGNKVMYELSEKIREIYRKNK